MAAVFTFLLFTALSLHHVSAQLASYIVHMDKSAMPKAFADHHAWYSATVSDAAATAHLHAADAVPDLPYLIYVYDKAIHGFSARLSASQLEQIKRSRGFLHAYKDLPVELDTTYTQDFIGLREDRGIWPASHHGKGAIIGVIDTGVWPESQSYADDGMPAVPARWKGACEVGDNFTTAMCNRKLIGARSFNRGLLAEEPNLNISVNSPRDTDGHGTHTSSTAGGNYVRGASYFGYGSGTAKGAAPRAHLAIYKVLWREGTSTADVLAGIDQAISDGVDVISISMSSRSTGLYDNPLAIAAFAAMERGIFVAHTAGNRGPDLTTIRHGIPWALTVGASTTDRRFGGTVVLGDGTAIRGGSLYVGMPPSIRLLPLVAVSDCNNETLVLEQGRNKVVLCQQPLHDLIDNWLYPPNTAQRARFPAIFIATSYKIETNSKFDYPAVLVTPADGARLLGYLNNASNPKASLRFRKTSFGTRPAPAVASYSSRGPSRICPYVLKPDVVAPGTGVIASYVPSEAMGSPFEVQQGTSMACPHAAGVAAMLKALHPDWSSAAIRSAMMTTASTSDNTGGQISDPARSRDSASPFDMGSGQLDPNRAVDPGLVYDADAGDYRRLLCALNYTKAQIRAITRSGIKSRCSDASLDLNYPSFVAYFDPVGAKPSVVNNRVREFRRTVTSVADGEWNYTAEVTPIDGFGIKVNPTRLVFRKKNEKQSFTLRMVRRRKMVYRETAYGWLRWVDGRGGRVVRSPVLAASTRSALEQATT
ncbi:hypothetical protein Taro_054088 [Colocasia esculenta]|uniref:Subtilisin-like protease n=1 Tax=Colocasia esculenta TaxID=4460 RepID=A0A843XP00_COLES|nr:hypothetical protein [Colocasia esculenta]